MNLQDCVALAEFAHFHLPKKPENRYDKSGALYIDHPKRVLASVQAQGAPPYVQMAAILHDVTEDTKVTARMLLDFGVPEATVEIVKLVDRGISKSIYDNCGDHRQYEIDGKMKSIYYPDSDNYMTKDEYYYAVIKQNPGARQVKLADIGDNLQPWRLVYLSPEKQQHLRDKYAKALKLLS